MRRPTGYHGIQPLVRHSDIKGSMSLRRTSKEKVVSENGRVRDF